jgi:hypothetical protein
MQLRQLAFGISVLLALVTSNIGAQPLNSIGDWLLWWLPLGTDGNEYDTRLALAIDQFTTPGATVAVSSAGALPYFANRKAIDVLGKCDSKIAHEPAHRDPGKSLLQEFHPGHMKWDYEYSLHQLHPDVAVVHWTFSKADKANLKAWGFKRYRIGRESLLVRDTSSEIRFDVLDRMASPARN